MSTKDPFLYQYMTSLVIQPLASIMRSLSLRQYGVALDMMEVFIISIHKPGAKDKLRPWVEKIRTFREKLTSSRTLDPFVNWASLEADRREVFSEEGPGLALQLYEEINRVLAEERYFQHMEGLWLDNIHFTEEDTQGEKDEEPPEEGA